MSTDDPSNLPAPGGRREAVREKALKVKARHARLRTARVVVLSALAVVVVGAVVTGVTLAVGSQTSARTLSPANVTADGGIPVTSVAGVSVASGSLSDQGATPEPTPVATPAPTSATTVDIRVYVDYLAEGAKDFEVANAAQLAKWYTAGSAQVTYYPVAMLTAKSNGTKYSLRAAGAAACVATYSPQSVFAFNHALLSQQPDMDSGGLEDADLASLAIGVGAEPPKDVRSCIENEDYVSWAKSATDQALAGIPDTVDGLSLTGTPLILVNGERYEGSLDDPKEFAQFVLTTASDAYYRGTPTPTPSVTATETPAPTDSATPTS